MTYGGDNVYPLEIEDVLHEHPTVADAGVIGIPDERLGEEVMTVVSLRPGASADAPELFAFCKERIAPTSTRGGSSSWMSCRRIPLGRS